MLFWQKFLQRFTRFQQSGTRKVGFFTQKSVNQIIIVKKLDVNHYFPNIYFYKKSSDKLSMFHATWGKNQSISQFTKTLFLWQVTGRKLDWINNRIYSLFTQCQFSCCFSEHQATHNNPKLYVYNYWPSKLNLTIL